MRVIVTRKRSTSKWYIKLVAHNGEITFTSQRFFSKSNAVRAAKNVVDSANISNVAPWTLEVPR